MKKIYCLLISLILIIPMTVNANVDRDTEVRLYATPEECNQQLALNNKTVNGSAVNGYYLSCLKVSCINNRVDHDDVAPILNNVSCKNGNKTPRIVPFNSSIGEGHALIEGATCSSDPENENHLQTQYATKLDHYNCMLKQDNSIYGSDNNSNNGENNNTDDKKTDNELENPGTGINTYYIVLGSSVLILSIGLYLVNKKNLFKKI